MTDPTDPEPKQDPVPPWIEVAFAIFLIVIFCAFVTVVLAITGAEPPPNFYDQ